MATVSRINIKGDARVGEAGPERLETTQFEYSKIHDQIHHEEFVIFSVPKSIDKQKTAHIMGGFLCFIEIRPSLRLY